MPRCLINGVKAEFIDVMDRGLHYGDGIFETILYAEGGLQFWDQHLSRMQKGADALNIPFPGESYFLDDIVELVHPKQGRTNDLVIKLILTRGSGDRGYAVPAKPNPLRLTMASEIVKPRQCNDGIRVRLCSQQVSINSGLAGIKHLNRLENVIARNEWRDEYHEGIMSDDDGNIIEGTMSNLFLVRDGRLYTPDLSRSGIEGIIRENILSMAKEQDIPVHIKDITPDELFDADEVFVTNSIIGIWPVVTIDATDFVPGPMSSLFQQTLTRYAISHAKTID